MNDQSSGPPFRIASYPRQHQQQYLYLELFYGALGRHGIDFMQQYARVKSYVNNALKHGHPGVKGPGNQQSGANK